MNPIYDLARVVFGWDTAPPVQDVPNRAAYRSDVDVFVGFAPFKDGLNKFILPRDPSHVSNIGTPVKVSNVFESRIMHFYGSTTMNWRDAMQISDIMRMSLATDDVLETRRRVEENLNYILSPKRIRLNDPVSLSVFM